MSLININPTSTNSWKELTKHYQEIKDIESEFAGKGYGDFKTQVAEIVVAALDPIRKRTEELMGDQSELLKILKSGADKANEVASKTLADAYAALGLIKNG